VVRVLVLVDEHVAEPATVVLRDVRKALQERDRLHDQIIEVERVRRPQPRLVDGIDLGDPPLVLVRRALRGVVRAPQLVLEVRDLRGQPARGELLGVQVEVARDEPDEAAGVVRVVDGELAAHPEVLGLPAQDADAHRVERRHPHGRRAAPDQRVDPLLHLRGGLVGEGDRHDLPGVHVALGEQPADAVGEHPRLARAGAGDDEQRRAGVHDGLDLARVEPLQQCRSAGGAGLHGGGVGGEFEQRTHRVLTVRPFPDSPAVWHTAPVLNRRRFFYGYRTSVPVVD
jgi:hypothetical protein